MEPASASSPTTPPGFLTAPVSSPTIHELTPGIKIMKTTVGFLLFLAWLLLFVFGMSVKADDFKKLIIPNQSLNLGNLLLYAITFTPTNTAVLASLAGVLGGFASNLAADNQYRQLRPTLDPKSTDFVSYLYMTENPLVSMLRGFTTYLIFIAGSYLTSFTPHTDDKGNFIEMTASSYFRFAVSISLLAYLAGYDPSRMRGLIDTVGFARKDKDAAPTQATTLTHTESLRLDTPAPPANAVNSKR